MNLQIKNNKLTFEKDKKVREMWSSKGKTPTSHEVVDAKSVVMSIKKQKTKNK